jgi:hypothetical protein
VVSARPSCVCVYKPNEHQGYGFSVTGRDPPR